VPFSQVLHTEAYVTISHLPLSYPVTGRGGLEGCEMLRIPHCLDGRLTDGGKVVSPMYRPRYTPQKHYFSASGNNLSEPE
jgi:hypothetical protein